MYSFYNEGDRIRVVLHKYFYYYISLRDLKKIGVKRIENTRLVGDINESRLRFLLLSRRIKARNMLNNRTVTIIDHDNPLPLLGSLSFGFIDRGTNIIEVRPMTSCNMDCIYCSVGEGTNPELHDYFVDMDYLLEWAERIVREKRELDPKIRIYFLINPQGEPLLYPYIYGLVKGLKEISGVGKIGIVTNGALLDEQMVDKLISFGLDSLHVSLEGTSSEVGKLYGKPYPVNRVINALRHAAKKRLEVYLTPVWIKGLNDRGIEEVVLLGKELASLGGVVKYGIQNYLVYKHGKKIKEYREASWQEFYDFLKELEERHGVKLLLSKEEAEIIDSKHLKKPFHRDEIVEGIISAPGRYRNEYLAVASDRVITITTKKNLTIGRKIKIKITRDKDNIFYGLIV